MAILDQTYLIGDVDIYLVDEDPEIVSINATAGSLIYYQVAEGLPLILYAKTSNGDNTDVFRLVTRSDYDAIVDPVATDDATKGYAKGSSWVNTTNSGFWKCIDSTPFSATWIKLN